MTPPGHPQIRTPPLPPYQRLIKCRFSKIDRILAGLREIFGPSPYKKSPLGKRHFLTSDFATPKKDPQILPVLRESGIPPP